MSTRAAEIARVAQELDGLLASLRVNVDALNAIISPGSGKEPAVDDRASQRPSEHA